MATLRAPGAPVTSASPSVIITASTLPAANASMDGAYSNQSHFTSTTASLTHTLFLHPCELHAHPGLLHPALLEADLERRPARPVAVADAQRRLGDGRRRRRR